MPVRILIADDNSQVRTAMREVLESAGDWEIIETANGEEAVCKAQEFHPALIILDLAMPAKDGLTASREISDLLPGTPILLHTLYYSKQVQIEAAKTGIRKVVPKSETTALLSAVEELLNPGIRPAPEKAPAHAEADPMRQRTEDRVRDLCAQILNSTNDAPLQPMLSELRDLLHTHIESFRARLAEYPAISERRARNGIPPPGTVAHPGKTKEPDASGPRPEDKVPGA